MRRSFVPKIAFMLLLALTFGSCGAGTRTKTLRVGLVAINAARDAVVAVSKVREKQIVDSCNSPTCTKEEGHARLDAWRAKVDAALVAIDTAHDRIHDAALLNDTKSASEAAAAIAKVATQRKELEQETSKASKTVILQQSPTPILKPTETP